MAINQPTGQLRVKAQRARSETKTARPQLFLLTKMGANTGGHTLAIINRTGGDALQTCLNRIPCSSLLLLHGVLNRLHEL